MHGGLGLGSDAMMVYNKDRSVYGMLAMNSPTANKLASIVKEKGFKVGDANVYPKREREFTFFTWYFKIVNRF